ncbi:MAG TPA: DUF3883 domain-containing protein [Verrucomicrobiae bacterium]|nr:DUF3883 domain-containing protein [Verrucomicrobiae bacterium]
MLGNLNEINRLLISLRELNADKQRVPVPALMRHLKARVFLGVNPIFEPIIKFSVQLGLVSVSPKGFAITDVGSELLDQNPEEFYELQPLQRDILVRKCYMDGALRAEMKDFVKSFEANEDSAAVTWSPVDSVPLGETEWLADHLLQLRVLRKEKELLVVTEEYRTTFLQFHDEGGDFSEEQLERYLKEKRLLGDMAEAFVVKYEQERLRAAGHRAESACVKPISRIRVSAGYDINSFDGKSVGMAHDRFIEVKGSGKAGVQFIWTINEMKRAEALGKNYWIYFVGEIDRKNGVVKRAPVLIQNPYHMLKTDQNFKSQTQSMLVQINSAGNLLEPAVKIRVRRGK